MSETPAAFARDGDLLVPRRFTESGWTQNTLGGRYVAGLVAWGAEQHGGPDLQPARLTIDMFRPATMAPTDVQTTVVRDGRRLKVVDVVIVADGVMVSRGSVVFARRTAEPSSEAWTPAEWAVRHPDEYERRSFGNGWEPPWDQRMITPWGSTGDHHQTWLREVHPFVDGEALTPLLRAALASDNASGQVNTGPGGISHINADLTISLARLPEGEWVGLDATSRAAAEGVSVGTVDLYDVVGRIGHVSVTALADARNLRRFDAPPEEAERRR
jgi:acyl-CoA thioesterase